MGFRHYFVTCIALTLFSMSTSALKATNDVFVSFVGFEGSSYGNYSFADFEITNGLAENNLQRRIDGTSVRLNSVANSALTYVGPGGNGKTGGVGTVSFDWRPWTESIAVDHLVQYRIGGGSWTTFGEIQTAGDGAPGVPPVSHFSESVDVHLDGVQIRIINVSGDRLIINNVSIMDYDGEIYDPWVSVTEPFIEFGNIDLFEEKDLAVSISNIGNDSDLVVSDATFLGSDSNVFSLLTPLPLTIPAGASNDLEVRFRSEGFVSHYEDAVLELITNGENPGGGLVEIELVGSVVDALGGTPLGILDDYSDGFALNYTFDMESQSSHSP